MTNGVTPELLDAVIAEARKAIIEQLRSERVTFPDAINEVPDFFDRKISEIRNQSSRMAYYKGSLIDAQRVIGRHRARAQAEWDLAYQKASELPTIRAGTDANVRKARATVKANEDCGADLGDWSERYQDVVSLLEVLDVGYRDLDNARKDITNLISVRRTQVHLET